MARYGFPFVMALLSSLLALPHSALAVDLPVDGGPGGGPFRIRCAPGSFVTGFEGRTGAYIDNFRILCGAFDATTRKIQPRGAVPITVGASTGGGPASAACPAGWAIFAIQFEMNRDNFVHHINFNCAPPTGPEKIWRAYGPTTTPPPPTGVFAQFKAAPGDQVCPPFEFAVGLQGRSGLYVDALGLICEPLPAAPQPIAPQTLNTVPNGQSMSKQAIVPKQTGPAPPPPGLPGVTSGTQLTSDSGPVVKHTGFTGVWNTRTDKNWTYVITFTQDGKNVNGTYVVQNGDKGKIKGKVKDGVLEFTLEQDGGYKGTGQFALAADGNSFTGSYRVDPNKKITDPSYLQGTWSGTRR